MKSEALEAVTYESAGRFLDAAGDWLEHRESTNNLMLGLAARLAGETSPADPAPVLLTVAGGGGLAGALLMTPPRNVVLYAPGPNAGEAMAALVEALLAGGHSTPGCVGPSEVSEAFARIWSDRTGQPVKLKMSQRIYELREVTYSREAPGGARLAEPGDLDLVADWWHRFATEVHLPEDVSNVRTSAGRLISAGRLLLWQDNGRVVSMAGACRATRHGMSIGPVYTPPEHRGRGYASACVAVMTQRQLDAGRQFCCLYTDLANPTSNSIYLKMGYKPVADSRHYDFVGS